jgi:hypothetical protein
MNSVLRDVERAVVAQFKILSLRWPGVTKKKKRKHPESC